MDESTACSNHMLLESKFSHYSSTKFSTQFQSVRPCCTAVLKYPVVEVAGYRGTTVLPVLRLLNLVVVVPTSTKFSITVELNRTKLGTLRLL